MDPPSYLSDRSTVPLAPLRNPRFQHISRSAAKRESVQLLGSIKDLQAHFANAGLVEHRPGSGVGVQGLASVGEDEENQPPLPYDARKREKERRPWKEVEFQRVDIEAASREAGEIVGAVRGLWGLTIPSSASSPTISRPPASPVTSRSDGTRTILATTDQSIRRIRTLALAVSHTAHQSLGNRRVSTPTLHPSRPVKGRSSFSTPSRPGTLPRAVSYGVVERQSSLASMEEKQVKGDVLADLRKAALDVLAGLRGLEESLRIYHDFSAEEEAGYGRYPASLGDTSQTRTSLLHTDCAAPSSYRPPSAASGITSQYDEYLEEDDEFSLNTLAQTGAVQYQQTWEERIVSEEREYRSLEAEKAMERTVRECVRRWITTVERIFSVGAAEDDAEIEEWCREQWEGRSLERVHAFLLAHLPLDLQLLLPSPTAVDLTGLLSCLSDGFITIHAFNAGVSSSAKSWGFIPEGDIHDTLHASGEEGKEWTFRRSGNLTCWAAAVRLRYNLPIQMPTQTTTSSFLPVPLRSAESSPGITPSSSPKPDQPPMKRKENAPRIDFNPLLVAKRGEGWERMFSDVLTKWVEEVARETRRESLRRGGHV